MLTRQLLQPSVNFFAPISTFTDELPSLIPRKSEPPNSRPFPVSNALILHLLQDVGRITNIYETEGFIGTNAQLDLPLGILELLDMQRTTTRRVEDVVQGLRVDLVDISTRKKRRQPIPEQVAPKAVGKTATARAQTLDAVARGIAIVQEVPEKAKDVEDIANFLLSSRCGHPRTNEHPQRTFNCIGQQLPLES